MIPIMKFLMRLNRWHAVAAVIIVAVALIIFVLYRAKFREDVKITLLDSLPQNGNTYVIDAGPTMPVITAKAEVPSISPEENSKLTFTWTVNLKIKDGKGKYINYDKDIEQNSTTTGDHPFTLKFLKPDMFRGGELKLTAKARINGKEVFGTTPDGLTIQGRNPQRVDVQNYIDSLVLTKYKGGYAGLTASDLQDTLKRISCWESYQSDSTQPGQRQFKAAPGEIGMPVVAKDNGVGLFQITNTNECPYSPFKKCPDAVFNWKVNADLAIAAFIEKVDRAKEYPTLLKQSAGYRAYIQSTINPMRKATGLEPIPVDGSPSGQFEDLPAPDFAANQILDDAVRGFNGFGATLFDKLLHEFRPDEKALSTLSNQSLKNDPSVWRRVLPSERPNCEFCGYPAYVDNVKSFSPQCTVVPAGTEAPIWRAAMLKR